MTETGISDHTVKKTPLNFSVGLLESRAFSTEMLHTLILHSYIDSTLATQTTSEQQMCIRIRPTVGEEYCQPIILLSLLCRVTDNPYSNPPPFLKS